MLRQRKEYNGKQGLCKILFFGRNFIRKYNLFPQKLLSKIQGMNTQNQLEN